MLKQIYLFLILTGLFLIPVCIADDNFYSISDNNLITPNYKIILDDNIISNVLIDNNSLYFYTLNNFYMVNKTNGNILYKLSIYNIKNQVQTDNFIYLQTDYNIYKVNKSSGIIEEKRIYVLMLKDIYSYFGVSGISENTIITNYINTTNNYTLSDNTKVNKSGDNISSINTNYFNYSSGNFYLNVLSGLFQFSSSGVPTMERNTTTGVERTTLLASLYLKLNNFNGIGNSGGAGILFVNEDNITRQDYNVGRFGASWENKTLNTSKWSWFSRTGTTDTSGFLMNNFNAYTNGTFEIPSGNLRLSTASKGIQLTSPDGNPHCIQVSNLNILITTVGVCT